MSTGATALKAYFVAGAEPTAVQFAELIDGNLNLNDGGAIVGDTTAVTGTFAHREKVSLLADLGGSGGAIRAALTLADSGTHFIVPALTGGAHTLVLPAVSAANVGFTCKFTMIGLAAQVFKVQTAATADKIITAAPDGDGTLTLNVSADEFHFKATATKGASFRITMISATAATAFVISDLNESLVGGTASTIAA